MSFGGASYMITSLKNNKRNRKSAFEGLERYQKDHKGKLHFKKSSTNKGLKKIRLRIRKEKRSFLIKNIVLLIIAFLFLYFLVCFVIF
jgi:hypothetical protein